MKLKTIPSLFIPLLALFACIVIAAVLGYYVFLAIGGKIDLDKIISKGALIFLILCTFPARRWLGLSWTEIGFAEKAVFLRQMGQGLIIGLLTLLPVLITLYGLKINVLDTGKDWSVFYLSKSLLVALFTALLVSFAEEPLFRGVLLTGYSRKLGLIAGILVSSFYYAMLHFMKTSNEIPLEEATLIGAFGLVADALQNTVNPVNLPAFLALLTVGSFLGVIREKLQLGMGVCIGCHTGWVMLIKMNKKFLNTDTGSELAWMTSSYDGVIGPLVTVWLMLAIVLMLAYSQYMTRNAS